MADRRKHRKIDNLPPEVITAINDAIVNKRKTYKEIEQWLRADGYDVSKSGVQRYGQAFLAKLERISTAREQAKTIIETSSGLKTEMSEATSTVAFQLLMEMLINTDADKVDKTTLTAIKTLASLENSTVSREKLKLSYDKGVSAAMSEIKNELRKELKQHPDLLKQMTRLVDNVRDKIS